MAIIGSDPSQNWTRNQLVAISAAKPHWPCAWRGDPREQPVSRTLSCPVIKMSRTRRWQPLPRRCGVWAVTA